MELRSENPEEQKQLQTAMKAVGQAIRLDTSGSVPDAYLHYLSCMQYISQCLLQDATTKVTGAASVNLKTKSSLKMVKLAQQCSERVADILNNMDETSSPTAMPFLPSPQTTNLSPSPTPPSSLSSSVSSSAPIPAGRISPSMFPAVPSSFSHAAPTHVAVVRPTVQQPGQQSLPAPKPALNRQTSDHALGPLEKAYRENRKLMAAYKSRLNKMHISSKNKSIVNLTFQRRLMENMAIARAREASLAKKIKERQQRLQEQAAQRFSSSGQPTKEEMELRTVYASILEYENVKSWLQEWRQRLQDSPSDLKLIHDLITEILSRDQHPLSQLLKRYQIAIYHKIMPLIQKDRQSIEEIVVPYRDVEPLKLEEPRAVPEGGFTTPDELDQSMEETLAQRLNALRENSTSSVESGDSSADTRASIQTNDILFSPSDMSDDILEELLSEDEEDAPSSQGDPSNQGGNALPLPVDTTIDKKDAGDDDKCEENGHLDDSGIQNGEESSSSDEAAPATDIADIQDIGDDDDAGTIDERKDEEDMTSVGDTMKAIRDEIEEDIEQAIEEGEKLCEELEVGTTVEAGGEEEKSIDDAVVMASRDSVNDGDGESANGSRTTSTSDDADKHHENQENTFENYTDRHPDTGTERTSNDLSDVKNADVQDNRAQTNQDETLSDIKQRTKGGEVSTGELPDEGERTGERQKEEAKEADDGEERIAEMRAEALSRHLKSITKDVLMFTERLQSLLVAVYEQLNTTSAKEQCISVIEDFFFKDIWQPLLMLFRRYNYKKEEFAAISMTKYQHALPQHIGVVEKFCLLPEGALQDDGQASSSDYPYRAAVQELRKLQCYTCPLQKIECIVRVSRIVIECVADFYESQGKPRQSPETTVGCDDLLPILSYVIMRSSLPQIVSECSAMEEFIHEGYLFGEEGYCLTTCQTALSYVLKLGSDEEGSRKS